MGTQYPPWVQNPTLRKIIITIYHDASEFAKKHPEFVMFKKNL